MGIPDFLCLNNKGTMNFTNFVTELTLKNLYHSIFQIKKYFLLENINCNVLYTTKRKVYGLFFDNQSIFCLSVKYLPFDEFFKKTFFVTELQKRN